MAADALAYLPGDVLTKIDRASMAEALEVRSPLLDAGLFAYCWALPLDKKIRGGQGKWLLREVLARHVPRTLFERPKQGFSAPIGSWLRGPLREWADDLLSESRLAEGGFLNPEPIRTIWNTHLAGHGQAETALWTVLMFQAWRARWMAAG